MIPDTPKVPIRIKLSYEGDTVLDSETNEADIKGYSYARYDSPIPACVTVLTVNGEKELHDPTLEHALDRQDDVIAELLWFEARSSIALSELEEAFIEWHADRKEGQLRLVG